MDVFGDSVQPTPSDEDILSQHEVVVEGGDLNDNFLDGDDAHDGNVTITHEVSYETSPSPRASPVVSPTSPTTNNTYSPAQTGYSSPPLNSSSPRSKYDNFSTSFSAAPTFTFLTQWNIKHEEELGEKARKSEEKHRQVLDEANQSLERFYNERAVKREKTQAVNREEEKQFVTVRDNTLAATTSWDAVSQLVDFNSKPLGKDTSRMKKILVELKH
eukprot:TRINITY_DN2541_c0_g1_i2.p1 TRINITY_DN2541_c0_g1~~TRINITY_DN2541_c0_g1_i2.p1  ORF type:complete len:216 (+),score=67.71 TRINITY_DN2541_c0_g1_i2:233-880(+)